MRFKAWFDESTNTVTVTEDDSPFAFLAGILIIALIANAIITFLCYLAYSLILIRLSKKVSPVERGSLILAIGCAVMGVSYALLIAISIVRGVNSTGYIIMLQMLAIGTTIYSVITCGKNEKQLQQEMRIYGNSSVGSLEKCKTAKVISIVTLSVLVLACVSLYAFDVPMPENIRAKKEKAQAEAQMAASCSIWDLSIVESNAIYGSSTKYDSLGNAYTGEYREFCAWNTPNERYEPCVIVDLNEKYDYTRFSGTIFTRPNQSEDLAITFTIYADEKCIYNSGEMRTSTKPIQLNLNITGVDKLKFVASTNDYDGWCNPAVILENATVFAE